MIITSVARVMGMCDESEPLDARNCWEPGLKLLERAVEGNGAARKQLESSAIFRKLQEVVEAGGSRAESASKLCGRPSPTAPQVHIPQAPSGGGSASASAGVSLPRLLDNLGTIVETTPTLRLRQTLPELEALLRDEALSAAKVSAIGDVIGGFLLLARSHCSASYARRLSPLFGTEDEAVWHLFRCNSADGWPTQLEMDEPKFCTSLFDLCKKHLAQLLARSGSLTGYSVFACAPASHTRTQAVYGRGEPLPPCALRFREARSVEKSPREAKDVFAADATLLIVKTRGVAPCTVKIDDNAKNESMFAALMQRLTSIERDDGSELVSLVLIEAKAKEPTGEKIIPHINAIYDQCTRYWRALLGKVAAGQQQPVGRMLNAAVPIFIGANFGKALTDISGESYDSSWQRTVKTALAWKQA